MEQNFDQDNQSNPVENLTKQAFDALKKEYVFVGRTHIRGWQAAIMIGAIIGAVSGVTFVANRSGQFGESSAKGNTPKTGPVVIAPKAGEKVPLGSDYLIKWCWNGPLPIVEVGSSYERVFYLGRNKDRLRLIGKEETSEGIGAPCPSTIVYKWNAGTFTEGDVLSQVAPGDGYYIEIEANIITSSGVVQSLARNKGPQFSLDAQGPDFFLKFLAVDIKLAQTLFANKDFKQLGKVLGDMQSVAGELRQAVLSNERAVRGIDELTALLEYAQTFARKKSPDLGKALADIETLVAAINKIINPPPIPLTVSFSSTPASQNVIRGTNGVTFANLIFGAENSTDEDIRVTSVDLGLSATSQGGATAIGYDLNTCQLWDGITALNTGSNVVNPVSQTLGFTFDHILTIARKSSKTISLRCNVSKTAPNDYIQWQLSSGNRIGATGATSGRAAEVKIIEGASARMTLVDGGTLWVSLDSSTPASRLVTAGSIYVPVTMLRIHAEKEPILLQSLALQFDGSNRDAVGVVRVWDGQTQVGMAQGGPTPTYVVQLTGGDVLIPRDGDKILRVTVDLGEIGVTGTVKAGDRVSINYDGDNREGTKGVGQVSGGNIYPTSPDTSAAKFVVYKSIPSFQKFSIPSTSIPQLNGILYRFSITADPKGPVGIGKFTFLAATSTLSSVSDLQLYGYKDLNFSVSAYERNPLNDSPASVNSDGTVKIYFNPVAKGNPEAIMVPAGETRYFELRGNVLSRNNASGQVVTISLLGDGTLGDVSTFSQVDASRDTEFIWSGFSTIVSVIDALSRPDWENGYLVPGLPAQGMGRNSFTN